MGEQAMKYAGHEDPPEMRAQSVVSLAEGRFRRAVATFAERFADEDARVRLGTAGVTVSIGLRDLDGAGMTLLLDRTPATYEPQVLPQRPDVRLVMTTADLEGMFSEGEYLPLKILSGDVAFHGPVRKFLRVLPILRG